MQRETASQVQELTTLEAVRAEIGRMGYKSLSEFRQRTGLTAGELIGSYAAIDDGDGYGVPIRKLSKTGRLGLVLQLIGGDERDNAELVKAQLYTDKDGRLFMSDNDLFEF